MKKFLTVLFLVLFLYGKIYSQQASAPAFFPAINSIQLTDVLQHKSTTLKQVNEPLLLYIFLSPECPLCQNYTKTINDIQQRYKQEVRVIGIVPGNAYHSKDIAAFKQAYHTSFCFYIDEHMELTKYLNATVTPQVILMNKSKQMLYSGAIDNWVISLGKKRTKATEFYLADAIEQCLHKQNILVVTTKPFGCKINDY